MTETPQPEKKMPLPGLLSVFFLTCGAIILLYAGYLWITANMSVSDLRDREKELRRNAAEETVQDDESQEDIIAAAREEQDALREEIKQLQEELIDMPSDERGFIQEDISEMNERLAELQQQINDEKNAVRDKPSARRTAATDTYEPPPELREKISLAKTLAFISLFFIVPGLLLRVWILVFGT